VISQILSKKPNEAFNIIASSQDVIGQDGLFYLRNYAKKRRNDELLIKLNEF
jgi:hypothetical protein